MEAIKDEDTKLANISKNIIDKTKDIEELNQQKKNVKIAVDYINKALEYVFFSKIV